MQLKSYNLFSETLFFILFGGMIFLAPVRSVVAATLPVQGTPPIVLSTTPTTPTLPGNDLSIQNLVRVSSGIVCWIQDIRIYLMVLAIMGIVVMIWKSQGDPARLTQSYKALLVVLLGILILFAAPVIIATLVNALGGTVNFSSIQC